MIVFYRTSSPYEKEHLHNKSLAYFEFPAAVLHYGKHFVFDKERFSFAAHVECVHSPSSESRYVDELKHIPKYGCTGSFSFD
jgi:hypothetical protein